MCTTLRINMSEMGRNISRLRKEKGITVREIQDVMGFNTPQAIFKWIRGDALPSLDNIIVLSALLDVTVEEIVILER